MNISSILITLIGIIIIIALYIISRISRNKYPKVIKTQLPEIKDENGELFSSILDDIPAQETPEANQTVNTSPEQIENKNAKQQLILFITAKTEAELVGDAIKKSLIKHKLSLGENNIYHYLHRRNNNEAISLFRVANGVEPWTLTDNDLVGKKIAGISIVMLLPTTIDNRTARELFIKTAESIATDVDGVVKNQQQNVLTPQERDELLN